MPSWSAARRAAAWCAHGGRDASGDASSNHLSPRAARTVGVACMCCKACINHACPRTWIIRLYVTTHNTIMHTTNARV